MTIDSLPFLDYSTCDACDRQFPHDAPGPDHCGECGGCLEHCDHEPYIGKFASAADEEVYVKTLDGLLADEIMDTPDGWFAFVPVYNGKDYIVHEDTQGFVNVESWTNDGCVSNPDAEAAWTALNEFYLDDPGV